MPPGLLEFIKSDKKKYLIKKSELLDLATFNWKVDHIEQSTIELKDLIPTSHTRLSELKEEISNWFTKTHGTRIIPEKEVFIGGSIRHRVYLLAQSYVNYGDLVFVPEPAIPMYRQSVISNGGEPISYYLSPTESWTPR